MKFRMIRSQPFSAAINMALDEAIVEGIVAGTSPPTIRFYTWNPSAISIGYFQGLQNEVSLEMCRKHKVDYVRRVTGGGAVYHDIGGEITYSILGPILLFPKEILKSYELICGHLVDALNELGMAAKFSPINDVIVNDKKISGSAQTRKKGILLQHGTVLYKVDVDRMFSLLTVGQEKIADKLIKSVKKRVTSVVNESEATKEQLADALEKAFSKDREIEYGTYSEKELERAEELAKTKYSSDEWNGMR